MSTSDKPKKPDLAEFAGYTISASTGSDTDGIYAIADCPICGQREKSHDHGYGGHHALTVSIGKVRTHMALVHKMKDEAGGNKSCRS